MKGEVPVNADALRKALGADSATATVRRTKRGQKPKAVITITEDGDRIDVNCVFVPMAKTTGPLAGPHAAAVHAMTAIAAWAKGGA